MTSHFFCAERLQEFAARVFQTFGVPLPDVDFDRVGGMLLGLAIGDALGNTTEGHTPHGRRVQHGEIRCRPRERTACAGLRT